MRGLSEAQRGALLEALRGAPATFNALLPATDLMDLLRRGAVQLGIAEPDGTLNVLVEVQRVRELLAIDEAARRVS